jgi:hypothetical protein
MGSCRIAIDKRKRRLKRTPIVAQNGTQHLNGRTTAERTTTGQHLVEDGARPKTSERASTGSPVACSGDMYAAVPTTIPSAVRVTSAFGSIDFARPKSSSLAAASVMITLPGFRSR